ncbi:Vacuolar protein sorting-associated protein 62 [Corchorus olitorius]|uniref:Vacuolar protein sorting-associated protein 62 n=1 Tax=Corchorus olitorius TaxID=93759 RepID=A0A1R3KM99_9ROSI|nr:Vacuolar protein sorting-associated protein 62 [Corchorus olitorius]
MVTIVIADAMFPRVKGLTSHQFAVAVRLSPDNSLPGESLLHQQSARTCGRVSSSLSSDMELVDWGEMFFFRVDSLNSYTLELIVTDLGKGDAIGYFSAPLNQIAIYVPDHSHQYNHINNLKWVDLSLNRTQPNMSEKNSSGKLRCAAVLSPKLNIDQSNELFLAGRKSGFIQISPSMEGPWTTVQLNYAAPAACWRLGNAVIASEVSVKDGNRYVNIRSLVSVHNNTDFILDLCLVCKASTEMMEPPTDISMPEGLLDDNRIQTDEFFETEKYDPHIGWVGCDAEQNRTHGGRLQQATSPVELPSGWEWIDDWHLENSSTNTTAGWVYAPDVESLKWPESNNSQLTSDSVRQRKWIRNRKQISVDAKEIYVGQLRPGDTMPLPLSASTQSGVRLLLRPSFLEGSDKYSWSSVVGKPGLLEVSGNSKGVSEIYLSALTESEELLCCTQLSETSSSASVHRLWFCLSIQATEISKDIRSDPILDWSLVVNPPLSITNYLPLTAEYSILEMRTSGHFIACSRGIFHPGRTVNIYNADLCNPLFFSLLPQRGWLPIHEAVLISHPREIPSKTISLRSSISGRIVQLIIDQNYDKERVMMAKTIRVYAPYWVSVSRCPPLTYRLVDVGGKKRKRKIGFLLHSKTKNDGIIEEITDEEMYSGHTIASALNFNFLGLSASITEPSNEHFGPVKDLSPLGDMDGSVDVYAYNGDGKCMRLFISAKPCPYQSVPTKVITVRPYMTFTNRLGQDLYIKLSSEDEPKVLRASDSRISFVHCENGGTDKLQVRLEDTEWSFPVQIVKEDTIPLVLRRHDAMRTFLKVEIRGYEEGSRFIVVFRLGSTKGPFRVENRTSRKTLCIRQSGFGEYAWISLGPLSTTIFSWEDPYGQKFIDAKIDGDHNNRVWKFDLERAGQFSADEGELGLQLHVFEVGNIKVLKFIDDSSHEQVRSLASAGKPQINVTPVEIIIELGVVGLSVVDHVPKELLYLYLDRVFISYSTGYDGGTTSRFKLIFGHLQIDNQLPLTLMPVLLAPEQMSDLHHPVFKMTITMRNANADGIQVYPYVYIRVTDKCWRLNIHEPIIWALVDFYNNLQLDHIPQSSGVSEVDPEIRVDLIDVSEVRLKVSLETAPAERPHGVLGVWSPILSAIGNALKIQVHLRRVMRKDRFMRRSSIIPAVGNRIWRDLIHNPLHLLFSVDVLGMTSSTLASLSKGFAELSTDGQFLQLRSKQVSSRRITGVGDGIIQGTEALAQGVAFGVSGVVRKPVESARQNGILGLAHGIGRAVLGFIVQPVSGALDFFSLTVDGIGASCSKCLEILNSKSTIQRIRNPRAIHADGILREYSEKEATGQMVLYLAEASRHFGCTEIFKEPSKFAWSDYYEEHFIVPYQKIVLVTNKRVMLLQCSSLDKMDRKPCKIIWDVPWEELMALELAKAGSQLPSVLLLHLKDFRRSETFARVITCSVEEVEGIEAQAVKICSAVRKMWKAHQYDMNSVALKVPSSQKYVHFAWSESERKAPNAPKKSIIESRELSSSSSASKGTKFVEHSIIFTKIWSSERELKGRCALCRKQVADDTGVCTIWRPICPDGYVSIGDIAHVGSHPPNVAAVYRNIDKLFALPVGYDLVWRNCPDDYITPVSIWLPRAPEGFTSPGCVAVAGFEEPEADLVQCVAETIAEETTFEEQKVWSAPDSYPWGCHVYQVRSDALHFVALRRPKEEFQWKPTRVRDDDLSLLPSSEAQ